VFYTPWIGSILSTRAPLPPGGAETQVLMLAKALVRRGLRVAIIAYGTSTEVPTEVEGVSIITRPPYKKLRRLIQRFPETFQIWRSLFRTPSRTIVYRAVGSELGVIAVFARLARRRLVYSSANIVDFNAGELMTNRRGLVRRVDLFMYKLGIRLAHAIVVQTEEQIQLCESAFGRRPVLIKSIEPLAEPQDQSPPGVPVGWASRLIQASARIHRSRTLSQKRNSGWLACPSRAATIIG
jgi:Glycosyl transferase 4-like domain